VTEPKIKENEMDALAKSILHLPKAPPPRAAKASPLDALEAARALGPHAALSGEELIAKSKQCHGWFLHIISDFARLHTKEERQDAKQFAWERRFQIKAAFWRGERRDDVICFLIEEKAASGAASQNGKSGS
jgi:hypothetical protein